MASAMTLKKIVSSFLQWLGAFVAFVVALIVSSLIVPIPQNILNARPETGFLVSPMDFLLNGAANGLIMVWAARRSSLKGLAMLAQLTVLSFGVQVFMTQIETAYFLSSFPLLKGNFELYRIVLRGFLTSVLFAGMVTLLTGGFSGKIRLQTAFSVTTHRAVKSGAWIALIYVILYFIFGYFVAWQWQDVRLFYGGSAELNSFFDQMRRTLMERPEIPVFQYFRGVLWMLCLMPLFLDFSGKRVELMVVSGLTLALLPTAQLSFPNPLMPANVSLAHFYEVSLSTGFFGALCAWFVPEDVHTTK
jgi:hypothetical protein